MKIIVLFLSLGLFTANAKVDCSKQNVFENYSVSIDNLRNQYKQINDLLDGKVSQTPSLSIVFGHEFDFSKSDEKIDQLKKSIDLDSGIPVELQSLKNCLIQLKLDSELKNLSEHLIKLHKIKVSFIERNKELNDSLRSESIAKNELPGLKDSINIESKNALNLKIELESNLVKSASKAIKEIDATKKETLNLDVDLTKVKIELLNHRIINNQNLEKKIDFFEKSTKKLASFNSDLNSSDRRILKSRFEVIERLWIDISSENYYELFKYKNIIDLPNIPQINDKNDSLKSKRDEIVSLKKEIIKEYTDKKKKELKLLNQLVSSLNSLRSSYFRKLGQSYFLKKALDLNSFKLFKNELYYSPYRVINYFYSKFLFVKEKISLGREGYVDLFLNISSIFFLFVIVYTLKMFYAKFNPIVDSLLRKSLARNQRSYVIKKSFSLWNKIKDNSSSLLWLLTLFILIRVEVFTQFALILKAFEVYLFAKILKSFVTLFLGSVSRLDTGSFIEFKKRATDTSDKFRNIFLFYFYTMILIEATVGKVYLYALVNNLVAIFVIYRLIRECSKWESEFSRYAEKKFSGVIVEKYFKILGLCPEVFRATLILLFILTFMIFDLLISYTEKFEISKKISANLFKKQIENVEAEEDADNKIPLTYKDNFALSSLGEEGEYIFSPNQIEDKVFTEISEWQNGKSDEHSLVVFGDKGIGKTTLLKQVGKEVEDQLKISVKYLKIPSKTLDKVSFNNFISSLFDRASSDLDIYEIDRSLDEKVVLVLDEAQNIFLSKNGGFEAYYEFINLINLNTENIFWIMSFNKYSWLYLNRAFGRTQYFRNVFEIQGWSDTKIKELIMTRHDKTSFKLSYDLLISATRSQDELDRYASVESKFFKLLWELSRGNPRSALYLWISALSRKGKNSFNVNIPKELSLDGIEKMSDDLMFVVASVLKHENLLSLEIEETTNLSPGLVRNAIKIGLEKKLFYKDVRGRYMVDISTQYGIIRYLRLKNFIYGS